VKTRVAALAVAVLTAAGFLAAFTPGPATAQANFGAFQAYANGTKQHVRVIDAPPPGGQTLANVDTSFSAAAANSQGLQPINNTFGEPAVPTTGIAGKNSYSRGAAVEAGIGANFQNVLTDPNQILLPKITEAAAAPSTALKRDDLIGPVTQADPLLYLAAATNKAQALWNPDFCPIGQPISYGENDLADAELLNTSSTKMPAPGSTPLISETPSGDSTTTNFNQSYTYLYPTGPSTFGVGAVNRQVFAPITLLKGVPGVGTDGAVVTLLGTWQLRVEDSGTGAPTVTYAAFDNLGNKLQGPTPVATVTLAGNVVAELTAQQLLGGQGLAVDIPPPPAGPPFLIQLHIGTPYTAIPGKKNGFTSDAVVVDALNVPGQINVTNVSYGHMEAQAVAPPGGVTCNIPTSKVLTDASGTVVSTLTGNNTFSWKITFPTVDISKELACDLTNIIVTDTATNIDPLTGKHTGATATITGASNGGTVTGSTIDATHSGGVSWNPLKANGAPVIYHPGDPPIVLTITAKLGPGAGTITNTANVSASLANCTGGALGKAFVTNGSIGGKAATIQGSAVNGSGNVSAKVGAAAVQAAQLATTGQKQPWLPVVGGGLLLGSLGLMRSRRRLHAVRSET
jgi:LPXTG-motif cell wall-anchored protein